MESSNVYQAESGLIFRVIESVEGGIKVELFKEGAWVPGRIGMAGLRLSASTTLLGPNPDLEVPT